MKGGPWTWVNRQDDTRRSCLDIGIVSVSLVPYISKVIIDSDRKFTPRQVIRNKKKTKSIYTDHFSIMIELTGMPRNQCMNRPEPTWNKGKPEGWETFKRVTYDYAYKIDSIVEEKKKDINTIMKEIDKIDTKIKFMSFGKTKPKSKKAILKRKEVKCQECPVYVTVSLRIPSAQEP